MRVHCSAGRWLKRTHIDPGLARVSHAGRPLKHSVSAFGA